MASSRSACMKNDILHGRPEGLHYDRRSGTAAAGVNRRSADLQVRRDTRGQSGCDPPVRPVEYRSMNKVLANADEAVAPIPDRASILLCGFRLCGISDNPVSSSPVLETHQ